VKRTVLHMIETGGTGGAETVYIDLIRGLDATRWRHVAVLPTREWMFEQLTELGLDPILLPERHSFDVVFLARMASLIRRRDVNLIHAHLFGSAIRAALLSRLCGIPAIATLHGAIDLKKGESLIAFKVAAINHGLKRVVFVSEQLRRSFLESVSLRPELATVITNGIDAKRFSGTYDRGVRGDLSIRKDEFVVGTVATPGRSAKGLDVLLDTASILKSKSRGYRFVVVGDLDLGRGVDVLKERDSRGLTNDVIFTGFRSDVDRALAAFDVYALTSRSEGFPLSLLEAMAASLPIVATRCGGPEQIIDDGVTGLLVKNGSAEAIASAIERLRANADDRRRLGNAAQKAVSERFTLEAQVGKYEKVYEECLAESSFKSRGLQSSGSGLSRAAL
jgi:glycosyltransferase involved in cell wall biosynthesis